MTDAIPYFMIPGIHVAAASTILFAMEAAKLDLTFAPLSLLILRR